MFYMEQLYLCVYDISQYFCGHIHLAAVANIANKYGMHT